MISLNRLPDWEPRLLSLIERRREHPFIWGTRDCMLFIGDAVEAVTGVCIIKRVKGTYWTLRQAQDIIKSVSPSGDYCEFLEHFFRKYDGIEKGYAPGAPCVCVAQIDGQQYGGVVHAGAVYIYQSKKILKLDTACIVESWKVGKWE